MSPGRRRRTTYLQRAMRRRHAEQLERDGRRAWTIAMVMTLTGLAIVWFMGCRAKAYGAVRVPIEWTAPDGVDGYEALARRPDGVFLMPTLWADSAGSRALAPAPGGQTQRAWVLISEDWRAGAWMLWVRGLNSAGAAPWSNAVVQLAGIPDTLWMLSRPDGSRYRAPVGASSWKRAAGRVGWSLQLADSLAPANIVHQEVAQQLSRARLCAVFGYWALRGGVQPCP